MAKKKKFYVVWEGNQQGIYTDWEICKNIVSGTNLKYKSFKTEALAEKAFNEGPDKYWGKDKEIDMEFTEIDSDDYIANSMCVDAACSGNPGVMEYRGVYTASKTQLFIKKFNLGTNNIGEFLAIVHGLAYQKQNKMNIPIYSDSKIALNWIKQKKCKTKLELNEKTADLFNIIKRAENWLKNNSYDQQLIKWPTEDWGEIPADFNRKK